MPHKQYFAGRGWGCIVVQVMFHVLMTSLVTSPGHKYVNFLNCHISINISDKASIKSSKYRICSWLSCCHIQLPVSHSVKQGKSEGFDSCDRPSNLAQIWSKSSIFQPVWPWNLMDDLGKQYGTSSILHQVLCIISNPSVNSNWSYSPEMLNLGQNGQFFVPCNLEIWRMTLQNNRAPLVCHLKLCVSFHTHWWIKIWITVQKRSIRVKIDDFFSRVT